MIKFQKLLFGLSVLGGLIMTSCGTSGSGNIEQFFANIPYDTISLKEAVKLGEIDYEFIGINVIHVEYSDSIEPFFNAFTDCPHKLNLQYTKQDSSIVEAVMTTDAERGCGAGYIKADTLRLLYAEEIDVPQLNHTLYSFMNSINTYKRLMQMQATLQFNGKIYGIENVHDSYFDGIVKNFAQLVNIEKKYGDEDEYYYTIYTSKALCDSLSNNTPELTYSSKDGMSISLKFYKLSGVKGAKAIVTGTIMNPSSDFIKAHTYETKRILSVLTENNYFISMYNEAGAENFGPRIQWTSKKLTVTSPNFEEPIVMKRTK